MSNVVEKEHIKFKGLRGTWYVVDETIVNGSRYYLLESEQYGDEAPCVIANRYMRAILENVYDGFNDLYESLKS